ncbi:MAG: RDD family protein, partial [Elusimicrobia bacterium]|nr:RDD family protein [Elusimicrobiota bacterium]
FIIFSIIFSFLGGSDSDKINISTRPKSDKAPVVSKENKVYIGEKGVLLESKSGEKISLKGNRLRIIDPNKDYEEEIDIESYTKVKKISYKVIFWFLYCWIMVWRFSATLGKMIMKIKVETQDGEKMTADRAFLRALVSILSMSVVFAGYLWALGKEKKTWHDIISKTRVVNI